MYQYHKLTAHNKPEANEILAEEDPFKVMQRSKEIMDDEETSSSWHAEEEMWAVCELKFKQCSHAQDELIHSKLILVEATGDTYWGSGLNLEQTRTCLPEY